MKMNFAKALVVVSMFAGTEALAANSVANMQDSQGKVMIDHGQGYVLAALNMGLNVGDRIFVGKDSSAVIAFEGCTLTIAKPTVFTVGKSAPCSKGMKTAQIGGVFVAPAADLPGGAAAGAGAAGGAAAGAGLAGAGPLLLVGGGIVAGGAILLLSNTKTCATGVSAC
jgi:hypothetical protein